MKKSLNKFVALASSALILATVLSGCSSNKTAETTIAPTAAPAAQVTDAPKETPAPEKTTLTFLIDKDTSIDGIKAVADLIEQKLNIATTIDLRPGGAEGDNLVKTKLATGDMDDLVYYNSGSLFTALNPEDNFVDVTNEPYMSNVLDSFKTTVSSNGKVFGIPGGTSMAGAWLYNKKVYADLGLSVPKTWDELMANSEKIKAAGKTAVIGSFKDDWTSQLVFLADYYNLQAQAPTFAADFTANKAKFATTPAALRAFDKLSEINKKGYMNKDYLATTYDTALKMLSEGTGVQYPMLTFALSGIFSKYPDKINDIGVFPQPSDSADTNGLTVWMPAGIYINNKSKNIEAAKKWQEFFVSPEGVAAYSAKAKADGPFVIKNAKLPDDAYPAVKEMLPYFDGGKTSPALEFVSPVKGSSLPQITTEVGAGIKTGVQGAQEYDKDVEKAAKQLKLAGW